MTFFIVHQRSTSAQSSSVCVCLSVRPSHADICENDRNDYHAINTFGGLYTLSFLMPKSLRNSNGKIPSGGAEYMYLQMGKNKNIQRFQTDILPVSETVQKRVRSTIAG